MALHCPATLLLVSSERAGEGREPGLAEEYGPWPDAADVVEELQAVADRHRGERVLVTLSPGALAEVLRHLGRRAPADDSQPVRLEVGDEGWQVLSNGPA